MTEDLFDATYSEILQKHKSMYPGLSEDNQEESASQVFEDVLSKVQTQSKNPSVSTDSIVGYLTNAGVSEDNARKIVGLHRQS